MTDKKATIFMEGNSKQKERLIHELNKLVSEANAQPELTASLQTESIEEIESAELPEASFEAGGDA